MRRLAIVGGVVLAGAVVPSLAVAGPLATSVTVTAPTQTYTQGQTPQWTAVYSPPPSPTPVATCTAGASNFTPVATTPPGVYPTTCTIAPEAGYNFLATHPGTLTVLPALSLSHVPALLVGGGLFPVAVTVLEPVTITVTLTHGSTTATRTQHVPVGRTIVSTPLVDTHGHRLPRGSYAVTVTAATNGVSTARTLTIIVGAGGPTTQLSVSPLPGGHLDVARPLVFTFSRVIAGVAAYRPTIGPSVTGRYSSPSPFQLVFTPTGFGFTPGATETISDRYAVWAGTTSHTRSLTVRAASLSRAVQLLAQLAYLPLKFTARTPVARTAAAEANAATSPPAGRFTWRYANTPAALKRLWTTDRNVLIAGAIKAFENDHGLPTDGVIGAGVWRALLRSGISGRGNHFGYSFVHVYRTLPQHLVVWHNGRVAVTALVNTGIPGRPTNYGVFPIYLREATGTMSGTNPNGTTYHDGGIRWISYFSGGDALHQFSRPGYGYPQSLGCVEMTDASAHRVWQLTEMGTLVDTLP